MVRTGKQRFSLAFGIWKLKKPPPAQSWRLPAGLYGEIKQSYTGPEVGRTDGAQKADRH